MLLIKFQEYFEKMCSCSPAFRYRCFSVKITKYFRSAFTTEDLQTTASEYFLATISEPYLKPRQESKIKLFTKIVNKAVNCFFKRLDLRYLAGF